MPPIDKFGKSNGAVVTGYKVSCRFFYKIEVFSEFHGTFIGIGLKGAKLLTIYCVI